MSAGAQLSQRCWIPYSYFSLCLWGTMCGSWGLNSNHEDQHRPNMLGHLSSHLNTVLIYYGYFSLYSFCVYLYELPFFCFIWNNVSKCIIVSFRSSSFLLMNFVFQNLPFIFIFFLYKLFMELILFWVCSNSPLSYPHISLPLRNSWLNQKLHTFLILTCTFIHWWIGIGNRFFFIEFWIHMYANVYFVLTFDWRCWR